MSRPGPTVPLPNIPGLDWTGLGKEVGLGAILGFAVGYAAKKAMKLVLLVAALLLLLAVALETRGILTIHWGALETTYTKAVQTNAITGAFQNLVRTIEKALPTTTGFALGCAIGFRRG